MTPSARTAPRRRLLLPALLVAAVAATGTVAAQPASAGPTAGTLSTAFAAAGARYHVPQDLLVSIAWTETHLDGRGGAVSGSDGYGVMDLSHARGSDRLSQAASATHQPVAAVQRDDAANIAGAAALLDSDARQLGLATADRTDLSAWYAVVERLGAATTSAAAQAYASEIYQSLRDGVSATTASGEHLVVGAHPGLATAPVRTARGPQPLAVSPDATGPDYGGSGYYPASTNNYSVANRPYDGNHIHYIVIHDTESSWASAISWFQNPASEVSAHFVVSRGGYIGQTVRTKDIAYHAGNWDVNVHAIGVEHEGYAHTPGWYTTAEYQASAKLVRTLAIRYGVPMDRSHIIGHYQVPNQANGHTDPGPYWNWGYYMSLVTQGATPQQIRGINPDVTTDFTGDGAADISVFRPSSGDWAVRNHATVQFGQVGDVPVPAHWFPGAATRALWRPSTGEWAFYHHASVYYGKAGDIPVPGDYYGTGSPQVAVFRPADGTWNIRNGRTIQFGQRGDIPVPGDYNHDGKTDIAIFRPSTGEWATYGMATVRYGQRGDVPVVADFNGDGISDRSVFRPTTHTWSILGGADLRGGDQTSIPVAGDWDADGIAERALFTPATGTWSFSGTAFGYGQGGDVPLPSPIAELT